MTNLPLIRDTVAGIYQAITDTTSSDAIAIPDTALGCIVWFEDGSGATIGGRVGVDQAATEVTGLTGTDTALGYQPPQAVEYTFVRDAYGTARLGGDNYLHVGSDVAGAVVRGSWLYRLDT